jgi:hypothetical protein
MSEDPWAGLPRLLQELCDGHPGFSVEVYAFDWANGVRSWYCKSCWFDARDRVRAATLATKGS